MSIEKIMSRDIVTVSMDDSLQKLQQIFESRQFHHLLVVESGKLMGVISDRDLLLALSPNIGKLSESQRDAATLKKKAHQIMTRKPVTITPECSVNDAIGLFINDNISCMPVLGEAGEPVGILTWRDVLKMLYIKEPTH